MARLSDYNRLLWKIKRVQKAVETKTLFKLDGFIWDVDVGADETPPTQNSKRDEKYGIYRKYEMGQGNKKPEKLVKSKKPKSNPMDGTSTPVDIPSFCLATHFYFRKASREENIAEDTIAYFKPTKLRDDVKYIVISATADEDIYKRYFGADRVKFYMCKRARYTGTLNQFYEKSMSRSSILNNPGIIDRIRKQSGFEHCITHKRFAKPGGLYYGNAEGVDFLKGKNIDIIGTPYHAEFLYKLFAFAVDIDVPQDAAMKPSILVTHNGYRFRFTTYEDDNGGPLSELRQVHFWMVESDLEQAVGRARLLRFGCVVNLFSSFPLRQGVMGVGGYGGD